MSLRIIIKPDTIKTWIAERNGKPVRRRNTEHDLAMLFAGDDPDYETLSIDELIEVMRFNRLVLLVDQEPGNTFHRFIQHG
ncbi:MAG TPA: hypothetical protein VL171_00280 [Verrucomicrobiae bacterium]|nr:hypothetical protein [Verrucomicrobiae bacterium]